LTYRAKVLSPARGGRANKGGTASLPSSLVGEGFLLCRFSGSLADVRRVL